MEQVPDAAILGAFWAFAESEPVTSMRVGMHEDETIVEKEVLCLDTIEILDANRGKACHVVMHDGHEYSGTIRHVLVKATSERSGRDDRSGRPEPVVRASGIAGSDFVLRSDEGDILLGAGAVETLTIENMEVERRQTETTTTYRKRLSLRFDGERREHELTLMYFGPGIRWIPTYRVQLSSEQPERARLSLQAELLNESEDLRSVPVDLVVGVPHFRFRDVVSPMVLEKELLRTLQQAAPQIMGQITSSNIIVASRAFEARPAGALQPRHHGPGRLDLPDELTAGGSQDLFLYHLPPITLPKGERLAARIFDATVPCRHVYTWDAHLKRADVATSPSAPGISPLVLSENQVWHQVELTNASQVPWTTGPAMVLEDSLPFGQDLLTYTPVGGAVRVPVTVSVDTRGSFSEAEIGRVTAALRWSGHSYVKISNRVELELRSFKTEPVDAEITLRFGGRADAATEAGQIALRAHDPDDWEDYRGSPAVNNSSTVHWTRCVEPGGTFAPSVEYHYFARE
jgi:hypothetical protein